MSILKFFRKNILFILAMGGFMATPSTHASLPWGAMRTRYKQKMKI